MGSRTRATQDRLADDLQGSPQREPATTASGSRVPDHRDAPDRKGLTRTWAGRCATAPGAERLRLVGEILALGVIRYHVRRRRPSEVTAETSCIADVPGIGVTEGDARDNHART